jgi:toxin-antitoxin system PIN domain toxin
VSGRGRGSQVILVDTNLLLYSVDPTSPDYDTARTWLDDRLNGTARVGLPWSTLLAFVRLASSQVVVRQPATPAEAWRRVRAWLDCDVVWIPEPGAGHASILEELLAQPFMTSRLVPDAHLAALALEHGLTLCSADGDFARFPGLKWENPLAAA